MENYNNDTDSTTSSVSIADETIIDSNDRYLVPIVGSTLKIVATNSNYDIELIDDFEVCLLRWLQIMLVNNNVIDSVKTIDLALLSSLTDNEELYEFFMEHRGVFRNSEYYRSADGYILRKAWVEFMSKRSFLTYVLNEYKVECNITNFYNFISHFFPKIDLNNETETDQLKLNKIYYYFKTYNNFRVVHSNYQNIAEEYIHKGVVQNIMFGNDDIYTWEISNVIQIFDNTIISSDCELRLTN